MKQVSGMCKEPSMQLAQHDSIYEAEGDEQSSVNGEDVDDNDTLEYQE